MMKTHYKLVVACVMFAAGTLAACSRPAYALDPYDQPIISCESSTMTSITLKICGGANTGAPAGVTVQWKTLSDYNLNGWADGPDLCKLSLSGQPSLQHPEKSRWELLPDECESIEIGDINFDETGVSGENCGLDPLECGTDYVFRAFAHAGRRMGRSDFTDNLICTTADCPSRKCTFTQGYWKTHGPAGCVTGNNTNEWPASALPMTLGTSGHLYTDSELCSIFNTAAGGNCLISLAHQLIAAKLNLANGATDCAALDAAIASATTIIGTKVIPPAGSGSISGGACGSVSSTTMTLDTYNNGGLCSPNCHGGAPSFGMDRASDAKKTSWGALKIRYR